MEKKRVFIIGGGASGLMAGIMAAENGAAVTILEQNDKPGKKICATGNGKCNLSNTAMPGDAFRGSDPAFASGALAQFSVQDTIRFFSQLGIYITNKNGYLYPRSGQAKCVPELLIMKARNLKVKVKTNTKAEAVYQEENVWKIQVDGWTYEADAVILANGSKASAIAGSDGSGYELAKALGHRIIQPLPALTALKCTGKKFSGWAGVRTDGEVTLCINGIPLKSERGELQLTEYGISGIPVFQLSRYAVRALSEGCRVSLLVNFFPDFSSQLFHTFWENRKKSSPYKTEKELLIGMFPDKLIKVLSDEPNLLEAISAYPLEVKSGLGFEQAQVCSGGVATEEVNPFTMESKLHKNLFFAGELLDIDGTCGGYNLQWAWSSGAVAGKHAAKEQP